MNKIKFLLAFIFLLTQSCDTTEPKVDKNITIYEIDVAVREAYIHLSFENKKDRKLVVFRDRENILSFSCSNKDTIITAKSLEQSADYKYELKEYKDNTVISESNGINLATFDSSMYDIIWETHYFKEQTMLIYKYSILVFDHKYKMRWFCV